MNSSNKWVKSIPVEILTTICLYNTPLLPPDICPIPTMHQQTFRDTINASQVCVRWYNIITSTPMLWNTGINPHHPHAEWTTLLLNRSKPCPISFSEENVVHTAEMVYREVQYADRLSQYCLSCKDPWEIPEMVHIPRRWPHLSFLCIDFSSCSEYGYVVRLPEDFPGPGMPNLTTLHLHTCYVSNPSQFAQFRSTLRELRITGFNRPYRIPLNTLLSIIQNLPNLKVLLLAYVMSKTEFSVDLPLSRIMLNLESFILAERARSCLELMQHIDVSNTTRVFDVDCTGDGPEPFSDLLHHILPLHSLQRHPILAKRSVLILDSEAVVLVGLDQKILNPPHILHKVWQKIPRNLTSFQEGYISFSVRNILEHLPSLIPHIQPLLDNIEIIDIRHSPISTLVFESSDLLYSSIITSATRVRYIIGMQKDFWDLIHEKVTNTTSTPSDSSNEGIRYPFTTLEALALVNKEEGCLMYHGFEGQLIQFCSVLKARGSALRYIKIYSSYLELPEHLTQELQQLGIDIEVEWMDVRRMFF